MKRFLLIVLLSLCAPVWAANQNLGLLEQAARRFVQGELSQRPGASFRLGRFDRRLVLPLCAEPQVAWSDGAAPSGNSYVDVYCIDPAWRLRLPLAISEARMGLVLTHPMRAGDTLTADDVQLVAVPDPRMSRDVLSDPAQVLGQTMSSGVGAGIWLRSYMVRPPIVVKMNQRVRVVVAGDGFTVEAEGTSTANGRAGDVVAVRMPSGQLVRGVVSADGSVGLAN
jgi:flagella basal body P-ring formation protein FlgA